MDVSEGEGKGGEAAAEAAGSSALVVGAGGGRRKIYGKIGDLYQYHEFLWRHFESGLEATKNSEAAITVDEMPLEADDGWSADAVEELREVLKGGGRDINLATHLLTRFDSLGNLESLERIGKFSLKRLSEEAVAEAGAEFLGLTFSMEPDSAPRAAAAASLPALPAPADRDKDSSAASPSPSAAGGAGGGADDLEYIEGIGMVPREFVAD